MSTVIGIDPSLAAAGLAAIGRDTFGNTTNPRLKTVGETGHRTDTYQQRAARIARQARTIVAHVKSLQPALVVIEGPSYGNNDPSMFDRAGVWWGIYANLHSAGIPIAVCSPKTRAKFATGNGNSNKAAVLAAIRLLWPHTRVLDDNQADALAMAHIGAIRLGWLQPEEEHHHHANDAIAWPTTGAQTR